MIYLISALIIALYLPNWGYSAPTSLGTLEISDFIVIPLFLLLFLTQPKVDTTIRNIDKLTPLMVKFLLWALLSTITLVLPFRYDYAGNYHLWYGVLKLAKLSLYGFTAILVIKKFVSSEQASIFLWTLLLIALNLSINLLTLKDESGISTIGFSATNATSVLISILIALLLGLVVTGHGTRNWRYLATITIFVTVFSMVYTNGRGGYIAVLVVGIYLFLKSSNIKAVLTALVGIFVVLLIAFNNIPTFRDEVNKTITPDPVHYTRYHSGIYGIDLGSRLYIWGREGIKIIDDPILGRGFFHRGDKSGLWQSGSHNFFIQMFLETGLVGGFLVLLFFYKLWQQAGSDISKSHGYEIPVKAALIAAITGGMGGEYFYGGMVLFTLLLIYASVGKLQIT